jgi:hypothetical protein
LETATGTTGEEALVTEETQGTMDDIVIICKDL